VCFGLRTRFRRRDPQLEDGDVCHDVEALRDADGLRQHVNDGPGGHRPFVSEIRLR
jgi:hypothetical protein